MKENKDTQFLNKSHGEQILFYLKKINEPTKSSQLSFLLQIPLHKIIHTCRDLEKQQYLESREILNGNDRRCILWSLKRVEKFNIQPLKLKSKFSEAL